MERIRRAQEHIPSVATSERWLQWFRKKDLEKKEMEDAKKARIEKRKQDKERKEEEKHLSKRTKTMKQTSWTTECG